MAGKPDLKIATFNLNNLQSAGKPMYQGKKYDQAAYDAKVDWTASILLKLNADIIGFQELWSTAALEDAFKRAGIDKEYNLITNDAPNAISSAMAVRTQHKELSRQWIADFPEELVLLKRKPAAGQQDLQIKVDVDFFSRPVLKVEIRPKQGSKKAPDIVVYVAHLKSKLETPLDKYESDKPEVKMHSAAIGSALSSIRRAAEAAALRVLLTKETKGTDKPVVIVGDINDNDLSVTTNIITGGPPYRLYASSQTGKKCDVGFYAVSALQQLRSLRDVYYTYLHEGHHESLDHILVSEQFYDYSKNRIWSFKELRIFNDHLGDKRDDATSDHGPMSAAFVYDPADK